MESSFERIRRLPPYVFAIVNAMKAEARRRGEDIIDLGMGNPDGPTPAHIVDKLVEAARNPRNHRYSASRGITKLRHAIASWYKRRFDVEIDPEREAIVSIGSKEGLSHLMLATTDPGDVVLVPTPTYPIHSYSVVIAGGEVRSVPLRDDGDFFEDLQEAYKLSSPRPKFLIINYPHNPTTRVTDLDFFRRVVEFAREHKVYVVHDFAYADLTFDGYKAPSFLQVPGAKDVGVELFSLTKSYNMAGWRVGFCCGNPELVAALTQIKSYLDYGIFQPIQIASIIALNGPQDCVADIVGITQKRRDTLIRGLNRIGWPVEKPKATMFVWAKIPDGLDKTLKARWRAKKKKGETFSKSLEFAKLLLEEGGVAVSPGIGFGEYGDGHVRFALVENEHRIRQAVQGIRKVLS